jgi:glycine oxidase
MIGEIRNWAETLCPQLESAEVVRTWAGLRPGSFDSYPYLGALPGHHGLFVAAGHFRHGLHWSTGTALLMRQLMMGEKTEIAMEPFHMTRGFHTLSSREKTDTIL